MLADRHTHRQTDRRTDCNTPLPYRGGVTNTVSYACVTSNYVSVVVVAAILLGHLKKDASEVKKALLSLDQGLLTPECLKQLIDFAPDDDEVICEI